ncbi:hypothetical protein BBH88_04075 [Planococcus antarcticus DSM 14505]|uniref:Metallo-beta-lactamase domain-containing protein n=1 Tax=Planococcus antarcticus DSM 14505 TaxID=1185653 RepID=A0ABM6D2H1_9BACL|nr:MBL fold metallo-hydrolase [Planococcus antarcticus]ANU09542.1 hypothetical protein BBH88_04075 [Planococcus antarcticus DSM 14505]
MKTSNNWHFQVGEFKLIALSDGAFPVSKEFFFSNTPQDIIEHIPEEFNAPLNFLLIDTGEKKILIDAGFGEEFFPTGGYLLRQLQQEGIRPEDIHTIIITHGHLDHIGGLSQNGKPVFSNAEHLITAEEWNYWSKHPETTESMTLAALKGQITFIHSNFHICRGISVKHTPGHTEGHLTVSIESQGTRLLVASDILNDPVTLSHPASHIAAELDPGKGMETRQAFLQEAHEQSAQVFACHYPFPGLGKVKKVEGQWTWVPLDN